MPRHAAAVAWAVEHRDPRAAHPVRQFVPGLGDPVLLPCPDRGRRRDGDAGLAAQRLTAVWTVFLLMSAMPPSWRQLPHSSTLCSTRIDAMTQPDETCRPARRARPRQSRCRRAGTPIRRSPNRRSRMSSARAGTSRPARRARQGRRLRHRLCRRRAGRRGAQRQGPGRLRQCLPPSPHEVMKGRGNAKPDAVRLSRLDLRPCRRPKARAALGALSPISASKTSRCCRSGPKRSGRSCSSISIPTRLR